MKNLAHIPQIAIIHPNDQVIELADQLPNLQLGDQILQLLCRIKGFGQRRDLRGKGLREINRPNVLSDSK